MLIPLIALACGAGIWFWRSHFLPVLHDGRVDDVFLAAPLSVLVIATVAALVGLLAIHALVSRRLAGEPVVHWTGGSVRYLAPLALVAFPLIALANLLPGGSSRLAAWTYLAVDFRPWLMVLVAIAFVAEVDRRTGGTLSAAWRSTAADLLHSDRRWEAAIVVAAAAFAWFSSPMTRFDAALSGDEPKYMRYCENWYQGRGMELSGIQTLAQLPTDFSPPVWRNAKLFVAAIPADAGELASDIGLLRSAGLAHRFNRAKYLGNWFLTGKNGGVYQIHTPGISVLLFPAYFVDRYLLNWTYHYPGTPLELLATNAMTLALYLAYAVLIFRFLRDFGSRPEAAALLAFAAVAMLPVANFPFQMYPEVAAGIFILVSIRYVLCGDRISPGTAALAGAVAGYLPWLHVRFLSVSALLLAGAVVTRRANRRAALAFAAAWTVPVALMCLYAFHVTGSLLPSALYDSRGEVLELGSVGPGLVGFVFDRSFGTLPQAPFLLLALAGLVPMLRRRPGATAFCVAAVLVTAATAASHDFMAAATTPGRYLVCIVPLVMVGVAGAIERFGGSRLFRVAGAALLAISLDAAWVYNEHHMKSMSTMVDTSVSGWKPHLLFPDIHGREWYEAGFVTPALYVWLAVCALLVALPWIADRISRARVGITTPRRRPSYAMLLAIALCTTGAIGTAAAAATGRGFDPAYLVKPQAARLELLEASAAKETWRALSSTGRRVRRETLAGGAFEGFTLVPSSATVRTGERVAFAARPLGASGDDFRSGTWEIDFGDGRSSGPRILVSPLELTHAYAPGFYEATATLVTGGRRYVERSAVAVGLESAADGGASLVNLAEVRGFDRSMRQAPALLEPRRISIDAQKVCADTTGGAPPRTMWIASRTSERWEGRAYPLDAAGCAAIGDDDVPAYAHFAAIVLTAGAPDVRSRVAVTFWPSREGLLGAPVFADAAPFALPVTPAAGRAPQPESLRSPSAGPSLQTRR